MSSHKEAPETSKDPVIDSSDLYAFVSPDDPTKATLIANYVPVQDPDSGPNFAEFGDDVLYEIHISNSGDAHPDISYGFRFHTVVQNDKTFLYNTGPITALTDATFNRRQYLDVTRTTRTGKVTTLGTNLAVPPCNIGPRSTPNYVALANAAIHSLPGGRTVFAGQRADGFHVDLGAIFDLLDLRPFSTLHLIPGQTADGINSLANKNVHTIALKVPLADLTSHGSTPTDPTAASSVVGVWTTASRQKSKVHDSDYRRSIHSGPWVQLSRLGNPLVNEVVIPLGQKDEFNRSKPWHDSNYAASITQPEVSSLLPVLYPGVFPKLAAYTKPRADLAAIFGTGLPAGVVKGFQNYTGTTIADMLRLNLAIAPTPAATANAAGVVGGDLAGYPNGRRVIDDVVTIELRALAGITIPLVDPTFTPDAAASKVTDGSATPTYLSTFPYLNTPYDGFSSMPATSTAAAS